MAQRAQAARLAGPPDNSPCERDSLSQVSREQVGVHPVRRPCAMAASHKVPGRWHVHAVSSKLPAGAWADEYIFEKYILTCAPSRIRTCAHGSGVGVRACLLPAETLLIRQAGYVPGLP